MIDDHPKIREIIAKARRANPSANFETGDIFPSQQAPILIGHQNKIFARFARWGFHQKIINARSESVEIKPVFSADFMSHRALVPITAFYEWDKAKQMYLFNDPKNPVLYLAAIYNSQQEFTIITAPAKAPVKGIHHRMPVIILPKHFHDWLFDNTKAKALLKNNELVQLTSHQQEKK